MPGAPQPRDEAARLEELRRYAILDTPEEVAFDQLTRLAANLCKTPVSLISLVDEERQWFKSRHGLEVIQTPRDQAFCGYTILSDEPFVVNDALLDERLHDNPLVACAPKIRFYAGIPLITKRGYRLGSLCVIDYVPRTLSEEQLDGLTTLAYQVVALLDNKRFAERMTAYTTALEQAHRSAVQASEAKSTFLANVNHELRTPLNAIMGFTEILSKSPSLDCQEQQYTEIILQSGEHLLYLIQSMLEMSRIEANQIVYEETQFNLQQLVDEVVAMFRLQAQEKGIALTVEGNQQLSYWLRTDARKLRQILINLLGNATKFTQKGSVTLRVNVTKMDLAPTFGYQLWCQFEVEDTGSGIAEEDLAKIFDAFEQADAGRGTGQETGLGLTISRQYARFLGGDISVVSSLGKGSCFKVSIPAGLARAEVTAGNDGLYPR